MPTPKVLRWVLTREDFVLLRKARKEMKRGQRKAVERILKTRNRPVDCPYPHLENFGPQGFEGVVTGGTLGSSLKKKGYPFAWRRNSQGFHQLVVVEIEETASSPTSP